MNLTITLNNQDLVDELVARGEGLQAAIAETLNGLGAQLLERAQSKIAPVVRTAIGQELFESIQMQAAAYIGQVCQVSVGIDDAGQPSYIVAYVREFGGEKWYDIYPKNALVLAFPGISGVLEATAEHGEMKTPGATVFAKHVWHPPAKERSYLRSSLEEMQGEVRAAIAETLAEVLAA